MVGRDAQGTYPPAAQVLLDFEPSCDFFVGVDSDGCAFDAMDIKHQECFTPCTIKHWGLQPIASLARETALFVNLRSTTRGLNRWIALKQVLDLLRDRVEVAERGFEVPEATELQRFLESPYPLSDVGIAAFAEQYPSPEIERAIRWGEGVNAAIADMVHGCGPFPGVREALQAMQPNVDVMTISATPMAALEREWNEHGLASLVRVIAGQEMGSKAQHVRYAARGRYPESQIMLIGDAPGDRDAAAQVGVLFYPILPGRETEAWLRFTDEALPRFLGGTFDRAYQQQLIAEFESFLPAEVPWPTISGETAITPPVSRR